MKTQTSNRKSKTKQNHTAAPWLFDGLERVSGHTPDHFVIHGPDGKAEVAHVYYGGCDAECAANAKLIAAAPELLAALKYITTQSWWSENDHPSATNLEARLNEILATARDAIAKAEGK